MNMRQIIGSHDIIWITLDTLRYDVAQSAWQQGLTPNIAQFLPAEGWEERHTPASFTYPAHQAFFAGFLPTPTKPGRHPRLFALAFQGSESISAQTYVFEEDPTIIEGLARLGYRTVCIGGVGFFNLQNPLGKVLPSFFQHAYWNPLFGTASKQSATAQTRKACQELEQCPEKICLFMNISAIHAPNYYFLPNHHPQKKEKNSLAGHHAALLQVDQALAPLWQTLKHRKRPSFVILHSDHGTAYGEEGYIGHRVAHPSIWNVPYTHFIIDPQS